MRYLSITFACATDGRPAPDTGIRQCVGEGRGYRDGDTLVVETVNFNDEFAGAVTAAGSRRFACRPALRDFGSQQCPSSHAI